ncbi:MULTISPECIES: hypothetical protein [Mycobacterium]|uniref:Type VII secretion protein EsxD n=4 Tax=Mycobacterium TaxID=1763 RepID=A0AAW5SCH5_MYCBC|nr:MULTISPECIES: hypothetical protein [Mycobacterium]MBZ4632030.1 hypothetical protein [Mycobacterium avium subsp. hominissuis]MCV6992838.1 hypothetical protein [Mycobacterium bouchedurhonense]MCV6993321.1 hypothetical protein [Mycobacterium timonense]MDV3305607.1 hypothetical protein [Mycobacterium avium subsp. hominissuis]ORA44499.1 hypothetical protein BST19_21410 [Mycobacterium bouchedurhonense]
MADTVLYNIPHIESALATMQSLNMQGQDLAHGMTQQYRILDEVSSGQATNRGIEFGAHADQIRAHAAEILQSAHTAVRQAADDQVGVDQHWAGLMGL